MAEFEPVLLTLPTFTPTLALEILPYGLTFHRIFVQVDGRTHDIVIGPEDPRGHITQKYTNTIIGRYANRVPVGTHALERNGVKSELTAQANESPRVSLHGGPVGFDSLPWQLLTPDASTLFSKAELAHLPTNLSATTYGIFQLVSPDGDQGYPGTLVAEVLIAVVEPGEQKRKILQPGESAVGEEYDLGSIVYVYRAKVDKGVTPINLTQHWGFNLEASLKEGDETLSVRNHNLTMKANRIVSRDADSLNTGEFILVSSAPEHDHNGKKIGEKYPEAGYDDFYVFESRKLKNPKRIPLTSFTPELDLVKDLLKPSNGPNAGTGDRSEPVVVLASEKSGLKLVFDTNQSGAMFYSNAMANPAVGARKKIHGGSGIKDQGDSYTPGTAAFLEFHEIISAFLDPANKDKEDSLLTSGELYNNYVRCDVKFKEPSR